MNFLSFSPIVERFDALNHATLHLDLLSFSHDCVVGSGIRVTMAESETRKELQKLVAEKEEACRKLKLVKMYRSKNDLEALQGLIDKWREACQSALLRLYEKHPEPKPSLGEFIMCCHLDKDLIRFDEEEETFT